MKDIQQLTEAEILRLAASGVAKVDLMGPRGTTLCTMDEIEAMAALIVLAGALPGYPTDAERQPRFAALEASS